MTPRAGVDAGQLLAFLDALRDAGYGIDSNRAVAVHDVLLRLLAEDALGDAGRVLRSIRPILCRSPEEQEAFAAHFFEWHARILPGTRAPGKPLAERQHMPAGSSAVAGPVRRFARMRRIGIGVAVAAAALTAVLVWLAFPDPLVRLEILSTPDSAQVFLVRGQVPGVVAGDTTRAGSLGTTPLVVRVRPGSYAFRLTREGYADATDSVDVGEDSLSHRVTLAGRMVRLALRSTPAGAVVLLDGRLLPRLTPMDTIVLTGTRTVWVLRDGYAPHVDSIALVGDSTHTVELDPLPLQRARLSVEPAVASITSVRRLPDADGDSIADGLTPASQGILLEQRLLSQNASRAPESGARLIDWSLPAGAYEMGLSAEGYLDTIVRVDAADATGATSVRLVPKSRYRVTVGMDDDVLARIGGAVLASGDTIRVPEGTVQVVWERDGFEPLLERITLASDSVVTPGPMRRILEPRFRVAFSPGGDSIIAGRLGVDTAVLRWNIRDPDPPVAIPVHSLQYDFPILPSGWTQAMPERDPDAEFLEHHQNLLSHVARGPHGDLLAVSDPLRGAVLRRTRPDTSELGSYLPRDSLSAPMLVTALRFTPDGTALALGTEDGRLLLWRVDSLAASAPSAAGDSAAIAIQEIGRHTGPVRDIAFAPDGSRIGSAGRDMLVVHSLETGRVTEEIEQPGIEGLAYSPDGARLAVVDTGRTVVLLRAGTRTATLGRWASALPGGWAAIVAVLLALAAGLAFVARRRLKGLYLVRRTTDEEPAHLEHVRLRGGEDRLFGDLRFFHLARVLRKRTEDASTRLDVPATVRASATRGGRFAPVFRGRMVLPEYLALIDRRSIHDHQARFVDALLDRLAAQDVLIDRYYFDGDPRLSFSSGERPVPHTLQSLRNRHPQHRLVVFGEARLLFDGVTGERTLWADELLGWKHRTLLTPEPRSQWGRAERELLASRFTVGRLTLDGLGAMGGKDVAVPVRDGEAKLPTVLRRRPVRWIDRGAPPDAAIAEMLEGVRRYLGPEGTRWLAACAAYPALSFPLTLNLGIRLRNDDGTPLLDPDRLAALVRLPWFRYGTIPDWLRLRLLDELPSATSKTVRRTLDTLLLAAAAGRGEIDDLEIARAPSRDLGIVGRFVRRRIAAGAPAHHPVRDRVYLAFMSGRRPDPLAVRAPDFIANLFRRGARTTPGARARIRRARITAAIGVFTLLVTGAAAPVAWQRIPIVPVPLVAMVELSATGARGLTPSPLSPVRDIAFAFIGLMFVATAVVLMVRVGQRIIVGRGASLAGTGRGAAKWWKTAPTAWAMVSPAAWRIGHALVAGTLSALLAGLGAGWLGFTPRWLYGALLGGGVGGAALIVDRGPSARTRRVVLRHLGGTGVLAFVSMLATTALIALDLIVSEWQAVAGAGVAYASARATWQMLRRALPQTRSRRLAWRVAAVAAVGVGLLVAVGAARARGELRELDRTIEMFRSEEWNPLRGDTSVSFDDRVAQVAQLRDAERRYVALADGASPVLRITTWDLDTRATRASQTYFEVLDGFIAQPARDSIVAWLSDLPEAPTPTVEYARVFDALRAYLLMTSGRQRSTPDLLVPTLLEYSGPIDRGPSASDYQQLLDDYAAALPLYPSSPSLPTGEQGPAQTVTDSTLLRLDLTGRAQRLLAQFSSADRLYQGLVNQASGSVQDIRFHERVPGSDQVMRNDVIVPGAFTRDGWAFVQVNVENVGQFFQSDAWVLGDQTIMPADQTRLETELRSRYTADYIRTWSDFLAGTRILPYVSPADAGRKLAMLSDSRSPLLQLLSIVATNTDVDSTEVRSAFQPVHAVVPPDRTDRFVGPTNERYVGILSELARAMEQVSRSSGLEQALAMSQVEGSASRVEAVVASLGTRAPTIGRAATVQAEVTRILTTPARSIGSLISASASSDPDILGPAGSAEGVAFRDVCEIREIHLRAGWWIDRVQLVCADGRALPERGGINGDAARFALEPGERLRAISGTTHGGHGNYVYSLQFHTDRRSSPVYGNNNPDDQGRQPFRLDVPTGTRVVGLSGSAGEYVHSIGLVVETEARIVGEVATVVVCSKPSSATHCGTTSETELRSGGTAFATVFWKGPEVVFTVRWFRDEKEVARTSARPGAVNPAGYRITVQQILDAAGPWEVRVYDAGDGLVARQPFVVR